MLDTWSEDFNKLIIFIGNYIILLGETYANPQLESFRTEEDEDSGRSLAVIGHDDEINIPKTKPIKYIPSIYLDIFDRILSVLTMWVTLKSERIQMKLIKKTTKNLLKREFLAVREILVSIRTLQWPIMNRYPIDNTISVRRDHLINAINGIFEAIK